METATLDRAIVDKKEQDTIIAHWSSNKPQPFHFSLTLYSRSCTPFRTPVTSSPETVCAVDEPL